MFDGLFCTAFGHRYVVERVLNQGARKVGCTRCGKHWAMHDATRAFIPWDSDLEQLYSPGGFLYEEQSNAEVSGRAGAAGEGRA